MICDNTVDVASSSSFVKTTLLKLLCIVGLYCTVHSAAISPRGIGPTQQQQKHCTALCECLVPFRLSPAPRLPLLIARVEKERRRRKEKRDVNEPATRKGKGKSIINLLLLLLLLLAAQTKFSRHPPLKEVMGGAEISLLCLIIIFLFFFLKLIWRRCTFKN